MPEIYEPELSRQIKSGEFAPLYYLYGADSGSVDLYARKLVKKLVGAGDEMMNLKKFDGEELDVNALTYAFSALPFFADRFVIFISSLNADKVSKSDMDVVRKAISDIGEQTAVVITAPGESFYKSKTKLTDKNERFKANAAKYGAVCEFKYKTPREIAAIICRKADISSKTAQYLAEYCMCDFMTVQNELGKLSAFCRGREITVSDINSVCIRREDADAFSLMNNLLSKNAEEFYRALQILRFSGSDSVALTAAMAMTMTDIYRVKLGREQGKNINEIAADFAYPRNREFVIKRIYNTCGNYSMKTVRFVISNLGELDWKLKSVSMTDDERFSAIEEFAAQLMAAI